MAVPNTSTFTLQDAVNDIKPTDRSLAGCIAVARPIGFVSSYAGSKDRLSNFRAYNHLSTYYY